MIKIYCFLLGLQEFSVYLRNLKHQATGTHETATAHSSVDQPSSLDWSLHLQTESNTGGHSGERTLRDSGGSRMEQQSICNSWEGKVSCDPLRVLSLDLKIKIRRINNGKAQKFIWCMFCVTWGFPFRKKNPKKQTWVLMLSLTKGADLGGIGQDKG